MHMLGLSTGRFLSPFLTLYDRRLCVPGFSDIAGTSQGSFFHACLFPSIIFVSPHRRRQRREPVHRRSRRRGPAINTMSAPRPTMKTIQKRFYTALPRAVSAPSTSASAISRVRSNSAPSSRSLYTANSSSGPLAFFDSPPPPPPPPSSRPGNPHILSTSRLPVKAEGEGSTSPHSHNSPHGQGGQPPFSLALTSPQANSSSPPVIPASHQSAGFFPYSSFPPIPFYNVSLSDQSDSHPRVKRHRTRYHLDVGAYGIPKHAKKKSGMSSSGVSTGCFFQDVPTEDLSLAVQVGEDAYFIRENAMGVADGVGGWSRARGAYTSFSHQTQTQPCRTLNVQTPAHRNGPLRILHLALFLLGV